ncbi:HD domain-containing protein [Candidatus Peribacteria bacterium]|nr:HD domain-containing protein [Candidatus Peribacteria bacterium]
MPSTKDGFLARISYLASEDQEKVARAFERSQQWHEGQTRDSGEPYFTHPLAVATYLAGLEAERDVLIAAFLHDVVEDGRTTLTNVASEFGPDVARLVDGVTKLTKMRYEGQPNERQMASLRKLLLAAADDLRIIIIKLADRWHNIETIESLREEKRERVSRETLDIYVPFARLVGLWDLKKRLEQVCFPIAYPEQSAEWHAAISAARETLLPARQTFVHEINSVTAKHVEPVLALMSDYELFSKLYGDTDRLQETNQMDSVLLIIRGSTDSQDCYRLLGEVHTRYPVHTASFRDFISAPMANGYRALHTTIFLSKNHELRLRIQTEEMFDYVSKRKLSLWINDKTGDLYTALASLHKTTFDKDQYLHDVKSTIIERINLFTTAGEVVRLAAGATGIDFAFAINPDSVPMLAGVIINGVTREPTAVLNNGDTVELALLHKGEREKSHLLWLEKIKTVEARDTFKKKLEQQPEEVQFEEGKNLLEVELSKHGLSVWGLMKGAKIQQRVLEQLHEPSFPELVRKIGRGDFAVTRVVEVYTILLRSGMSLLQQVMNFFSLLRRERVLDRSSQLIDIEVYSEDRPSMIYNITRCIAEAKMNIAKFEAFALPPKDAVYKIRLEAQSFEQFSKLYDALLQLQSVNRIVRRN